MGTTEFRFAGLLQDAIENQDRELAGHVERRLEEYLTNPTVATLDVGGDDATSVHIDEDGNFWVGAATFATAPFRVSSDGNLDIGGADTTSLHVDDDGNLWLGAATYADAPFKVSNAGAIILTASGGEYIQISPAECRIEFYESDDTLATYMDYDEGGDRFYIRGPATASEMYFYANGDTYWDGTQLILQASNTNRMTISTSGIELHDSLFNDSSSGSASNTSPRVVMSDDNWFWGCRSGAAALFLQRTTSDGAVASFIRETTTVGSISVTSTNTAYNVSSDERLKTHLGPVDTDPLSKINWRHYRWNDSGAEGDGAFAQEVFKEYPDAVTVGEGSPGDEDFVPWQIDYSKFVPMVAAKQQELERRIEAIEKQLADMVE